MLQMPLWAPSTDGWEPTLVGELPDWPVRGRVSIDVETNDPDIGDDLGAGWVRRRGFIAGYSFAIEDGPSHYVPLRHLGGDNVADPAQGMAYLRAQAARFQGVVVGHNLQYDLGWLGREGVEFSEASWFRDTMVADPLIYELHPHYNLASVCERWGVPSKDEVLLLEALRLHKLKGKGDLWKLPARYVAPYGRRDAAAPLEVLRKQEREIERQELHRIFDLESRVLPVLVAMTRRGVRLDLTRLAAIERWALTEETQALARVHHLTGVRIAVGGVWVASALAPALRAIGIEPGKTATGQDSIDKALLSADHDVTRALARARKVNKLRTTFAASIRRHADGDRLRPQYNQLPVEKDDGVVVGARFGRLSSEHPNIQQQPARDEFSKEWRSIYLPDDELWASNDYSQQEPRWTTHYAELAGVRGGQEAAQAYRDDPLLDNHEFMAQLTGLPRKVAKNIFLGLCYEMGGAKLCEGLGLPSATAVRTSSGRFIADYEPGYAEVAAGSTVVATFRVAGQEGAAILRQFDERAGYVRLLSKECKRRAAMRGYVVTAGGRRCRFPPNGGGGYDWVHKALNRIIQGSSADQMKLALVQLDAAGHRPQIQVHDEVGASVPNTERALEAAEIMRDAMKARVPFRVDTEVGPSWGEAT